MGKEYEEEEEVLEEELEDEEEDDRGDDFQDEDEEDEELEEEELEEDEDEDEDSEEEEEDSPKNAIPQSRLNEVIQQRNDERDRTAWLEEQLETLISKKQEPVVVKEEVVKEVYDYEGEEANYIDLIIEGETAKAAKLRQVIDGHRQEDMQEAMKSARDSAAEEAFTRAETSRDEEKFLEELVKAKEKYSFLDDESDDYNQEAVEDINAAMAGYAAKGKTNSAALKMAVTRFAKYYETTEEKTEKLGNKRTKTTRKKAAKASNQQPPKTPKGKKGVSRDLDDVDVNKLSDRDFSKLTSREKKILRGD